MEAAKGKVLAVRKRAMTEEIYTTITQERLVFPNPEAETDEKAPQWIYAYEEKDGVLYLPREFRIHDLLPDLKVADKLHDGEELGDHIRCEIKLEPYQVRPVMKARSVTAGTLVAPCGAGKTVMGLNIIYEKGRVALVLVNKESHMDQWAESVKKFLPGAHIGFIGGRSQVYMKHRVGENDWKHADVIIATIQTLTKGVPDEITARCGTVLVDEAHHSAARTFVQTFRQLKPRNLLSVTATPKRKDGLEVMYVHFLGPIFDRVTQEELRQHNRTVNPKVQFIYTNRIHHVPIIKGGYNHAKAISVVTNDDAWNEIILELCKKSEGKDRWALVLSERVDHCTRLAEAHQARGGDAGVVTGSIGTVAEAFSHRVCFATLQLAAEGLDQPRLNTLILATPFSSESRMIQAVGRAVRACQDKTGALVFVLVGAHPVLYRMAQKQEEACKTQGWNTSWVKKGV